MKHLSILISAILFSTFFYQQGIGINLLLFSVLTILVLAINNHSAFKNRHTLIMSCLYLMTGVMVFVNQSSLSILSNYIAFFSLIGITSNQNASLYINWLNGFYTSIAGVFHRNFEVNKSDASVSVKKEIDVWHWTKLIGIPLVTIIIFIIMYKDGNPLFNDLISKINFRFINFHWILMVILGYFLFINIIQPVTIEPATTLDISTKNNLLKSDTFNIISLKKETQLGTTLLTLLNLLILVYLFTDIIFLTESANFTAAQLSDQVHNGINALIASILFAIVILLFVFRGNVNFYKANKTLKKLSYLWLFLNLILVVDIIIKNTQYVSAFGLTYKRIGVYIYLLLTLSGLISTFIKISRIKNLWFLFRVNTQVSFAILLLTTTVNWDIAITHFNLNDAETSDINYLINLSNNNAFLLKNYLDKHDGKLYFNTQINLKYKRYLDELKHRNWQEKGLIDFTQSETIKNYNY